MYEAPYETPTTTADVMKYPVGQSPYGHVIVGARSCDSNTSFTVAAAGAYDAVFRATDSLTKAHEHNGAYWYFYKGSSMGFADSASIQLGPLQQEAITASALSADLPNTVTSGQYVYATIDSADPFDRNTRCQSGYQPLPDG